MDGDVKTLELDKVCRVCLTIKKDMRPLYGEMIAEMLMDCTRIQVNIFKDCIPFLTEMILSIFFSVSLWYKPAGKHGRLAR